MLGDSHQVIDLVGEESISKIWYLDLTIQLSLKVDIRDLLSQLAQCYWVTENGDRRMFNGELTSVRGMGSFSLDSQRVVVRLCSRFHRLEKSGGTTVFKESCFRDIIFEFMKKHQLLSHMEVFFVSDVGTEKLIYTQQFSEESDVDFINRYCQEQGWLWLLRISDLGKETVYFFKKSVKSLPIYTRYQGVLDNFISLKSALINKKFEFFQYMERVENNVIIRKMSSLSPWIALGDRCEPTEDSVVVSIKHYFGFVPELPKSEQYRNKLCLAEFKTYLISISYLPVFSSPFQYGFVKSDVPYAAIDNSGDYAVEVLSDGISVPIRTQHTMQPLLGYGGELSHFSGFPTGMQGLWYSDTEVLLTEWGQQGNALKICGAIANPDTINPVVSENKTIYQWRTPSKLSLSFEDTPKKQKISWTTELTKNRLIMGDFDSDKQRIELDVAFGMLHVSGNQGISISSEKKIKEWTSCSRYSTINNRLHLKNQHDKVHYEASRKAVFDFQQSMCVKSKQVHWRAQSTCWWSSKIIELNGNDLLRIEMSSGDCSMEASYMDIVGLGGEMTLRNSAGASKICISHSGKITVMGSTIAANGTITIKGHINSAIRKPTQAPLREDGFVLELKEPCDLPRIMGGKEVREHLCKELFDPFDQKIKGECHESGWLNSAVIMNKKNVKLDGMQIKKERDNSNPISEFMLLNKFDCF